MIETPNGDDAFELPPELELELRELETLIGGKEGKEAAQQQRLAYLLADELGPRLIQAKGVEIPAEMTQKLVDENFTARSEEHTSELQSQSNLVCRLLLEKKN